MYGLPWDTSTANVLMQINKYDGIVWKECTGTISGIHLQMQKYTAPQNSRIYFSRETHAAKVEGTEKLVLPSPEPVANFMSNSIKYIGAAAVEHPIQ